MSGPSVILIWRKEKEPLIRHDSNLPEQKRGKYVSRIDHTLSLALLDISNVTFEDAGNYSCFVYQSLMGITPAHTWTLSVQGKD